MKKRLILPLAALLCLLVLAGCKTVTQTNIDFDANSFTKAQKIVVHDAAGNEKTVLTEKADIDAFVESVNVDGWRITELPGDLTPAGSFTLWQAETVTALIGEKGMKLQEICTFLIYQDGDYLTIDTGFAGITIPFAIPQSTAEYLRELAA